MSDLIIRLTYQEIQSILIEHVAEAYDLEYDTGQDEDDVAICDVVIEVPNHGSQLRPFVKHAELTFPNDRNFEEFPDDGQCNGW